MHPVLTTVHVGDVELPIASYGVMLVVALLTGALGTLRAALAGRPPLELGAVISALGLAITFGFSGALLVHAAAQLARTGSPAAALEQPGVSVLDHLTLRQAANSDRAGALRKTRMDTLEIEADLDHRLA